MRTFEYSGIVALNHPLKIMDAFVLSEGRTCDTESPFYRRVLVLKLPGHALHHFQRGANRPALRMLRSSNAVNALAEIYGMFIEIGGFCFSLA